MLLQVVPQVTEMTADGLFHHTRAHPPNQLLRYADDAGSTLLAEWQQDIWWLVLLGWQRQLKLETRHCGSEEQ